MYNGNKLFTRFDKDVKNNYQLEGSGKINDRNYKKIKMGLSSLKKHNEYLKKINKQFDETVKGCFDYIRWEYEEANKLESPENKF